MTRWSIEYTHAGLVEGVGVLQFISVLPPAFGDEIMIEGLPRLRVLRLEHRAQIDKVHEGFLVRSVVICEAVT